MPYLHVNWIRAFLPLTPFPLWLLWLLFLGLGRSETIKSFSRLRDGGLPSAATVSSSVRTIISQHSSLPPFRAFRGNVENGPGHPVRTKCPQLLSTPWPTWGLHLKQVTSFTTQTRPHNLQTFHVHTLWMHRFEKWTQNCYSKVMLKPSSPTARRLIHRETISLWHCI